MINKAKHNVPLILKVKKNYASALKLAYGWAFLSSRRNFGGGKVFYV